MIVDRCEIDGTFEFRFENDFSRAFIDDLKDEVPGQDRSYSEVDNSWTIKLTHWQTFWFLVKKHFPD